MVYKISFVNMLGKFWKTKKRNTKNPNHNKPKQTKIKQNKNSNIYISGQAV